MKNNKKIIPFYGGDHPEMFEVERRCMDRDGVVINFLDKHLPVGKILDTGAGNGFTAEALMKKNRLIVPLEPNEKMIDKKRNLLWVKGVAQELPFKDNTFNGAYATWAFFFTDHKETDTGLKELYRVVRPDGPVIIIDNAGDDEFCSFSEINIASSPVWWQKRNFKVNILNTNYKFDSIEEARKLMNFYFGKKGQEVNKKVIAYKVAAYVCKNSCNLKL